MKNYATSEFLYLTASDFFKKGLQVANEIFSSDYKNDEDLFYKFSFPATNISFALELALKGLHFYEGDKAPQGHSLYTLFTSLPGSYQKDILNRMKSNYLFENFKNVKISIKSDSPDQVSQPSNRSDLTYNEKVLLVLKEQQNSFVNFRYLHEFEISDNTSIEYDFHTISNCTHCTLKEFDRNLKSTRIVFKLKD